MTDGPWSLTYDGNGRLTKDTNRGIGSITYDPCNNPQAITFTGTNGIEYTYAPDGTKLRTVHKVSGIGGSVTRDTTDYLGNLVMRNRHLSSYQFDGGYVSFNNDTIDGWHYFISDYMGNNRMVVNSDGTVEQVTHYYPYGGVIGDISTNENLQKYKFEGKELDRTFGLDNYDIHARQYFAMAPMWDRIDSLAEKYYSISPYAYCGGDPVNLGDYDGKQFITFMGTSNPIMLGTSEVIVSGRTPILGTADKVSTLGRSASESQNSKLLHPEQNHHIIPRQAAKLKQTKVARKEGFKVDGRENKISVSRFSRQDGKGQHGNLPNYNKQILDELRNMTEEKGGPSLAEQFRNLVEKIRHIIMENPKTKINDIELKSTNSTTIKK